MTDTDESLPHPEPVAYRSMMPPAVIELTDLHKTLGDRPVLDGVSLQVFRGETLCIIGGSGAGKSVTLKHIVGLLRPDRGRVRVDGVEVTTAGPTLLGTVRKKIGFLFQGAALLNSLTVFENVALPLREHEELAEAEVRSRVMERLELVHLADAAGKLPGDLSGGMKKRAGLARAIVRDPGIILYDEPTAGLDPVIASTINDLILEMQRRLKVTSVLVTHDMSSCFRVSSRIAMLLRGRIHKVGRPDELKSSDDPAIRQFVHGESEGPLTRESNRVE